MKIINEMHHLKKLQMLRFIAAFMVLIVHVNFYTHERVDQLGYVWAPGSQGVQIFFLISGFVMLLSADKLKYGLSSSVFFLKRRIVRIVPMYWIFTTAKLILALVLVDVAMHNRPRLLYTLGSYLLFPVSSADGGIAPLHGVGWTLLHEMFFYYLISISILLGWSAFRFTSIAIVVLFSCRFFFDFDSAFFRVVTSENNLHFVFGMLLAKIYLSGFRLNAGVSVILTVCIFIFIMHTDGIFLAAKFFW
ncbi:acyltransferase [Deefgea sp. CFH1-16]|uniref:acyltransferase family protein n=1 Tax=Deefgea sp. CFH1-16 TaxID=2675457 RepID=UPI0015F754BB|nr:acyltransferase [Deefgea sp. CFH1-16]MBM5574878.1 acyltransferase family protein [Deefgea sp. CFH1-16]